MVGAHHHPKRTGQVALVGVAGAHAPAEIDALAALFQALRRAVGWGAQLLQHIFQCGLTDEVACILLTQALHCRLLVASVVPQKHQRLAGKAAYPGQELDAVHVLQPALRRLLETLDETGIQTWRDFRKEYGLERRKVTIGRLLYALESRLSQQ